MMDKQETTRLIGNLSKMPNLDQSLVFYLVPVRSVMDVQWDQIYWPFYSEIRSVIYSDNRQIVGERDFTI